MNELPSGWAECEIGDVTTVVAGGTPPAGDKSNFTDNGGIHWLTPADLSGYGKPSISRGARNLSQKGFDSCSAVKMPAGSVLFSSRAPVGYVCIADEEISTNQGFKSFVLPEGLESKWVYYWLRHIKPIAEQMATGTTFKELSGSAAKKLPLRAAPTAEQKRIVDTLDALLARVDAARARLDRVRALLKRFRQSVLAAATSGALTEDWRLVCRHPRESVNRSSGSAKAKTLDSRFRGNDEMQGDGWTDLTISDVAAVGTGSTPLRSNKQFYSTQGTPWVTSAATSKKFIDSSDEFVTDQAIKAHRLKVYPVGTLLVAMYGEGKTRGQVAELAIPATINQACASVQVDEAIADRRYVRFVLESNYYEMRKLAEGGNQPNLNLSKVKGFPIRVPSLTEQNEIIRRVEALLSLADKVQAQYAAARARIDRLTPALLAKAFRGELVPQDPNDEPASVLLDRIRAERTAAPATVRRARKTKKAAVS